MNSDAYPVDALGSLVVRVSTARGAIPLENATVNLRDAGEGRTGILYSLRTDRDGKTPRVTLPTPSREISESPGGIPYSLYAADVYAEGYLPLTLEQIPLFPSVLSLQPAVLIPLGEYGGALPEYGERSIPTGGSADL